MIGPIEYLVLDKLGEGKMKDDSLSDVQQMNISKELADKINKQYDELSVGNQDMDINVYHKHAIIFYAAMVMCIIVSVSHSTTGIVMAIGFSANYIVEIMKYLSKELKK